DVNGSLEYGLTWKRWDMPSGPPICALRASARRTSDNGYGGWQSPRARGDAGGTRWKDGEARNLEDQARLAGWRTPSGSDGEGGTMDVLMAIREGYTPKLKLRDQAPLAGWATPTARDYRSEKASDDYNQKREAHPRGKPLSYQALGAIPSGSPAPTERRGALNPAFSLWLMGFPE